MAALISVLTFLFLTLFARGSSEISLSNYYDSPYYHTQQQQLPTLIYPYVDELTWFNNQVRRVPMKPTTEGNSGSANGRTFGAFANLFGLQTLRPMCPMCPSCPSCPMCPTTTCPAPASSSCVQPPFTSPLSITPCTARMTLTPSTAVGCTKIATAPSGTFTVTLGTGGQFAIFGIAVICPNTKVTVTCLIAGTGTLPIASTINTPSLTSGTPALETGSTQVIVACTDLTNNCLGGKATCSWTASA